MKDEKLARKALLDEFLEDWHYYCKGYDQSGYPSACCTFKESVTSKQWESIQDIHDDQKIRDRRNAISFAVLKCTPDPYRAAINAYSHNLATGFSVWGHPCLPTNLIDRTKIVNEALSGLTEKLMKAGVL